MHHLSRHLSTQALGHPEDALGCHTALTTMGRTKKEEEKNLAAAMRQVPMAEVATMAAVTS